MVGAAGEFASAAMLIASIGILLRICWTDFFYLKIWNLELLALTGVAALFLLFAAPDDLFLRLGLGTILFSLSFTFWLFGWLGAGDVKLLGIVGCLIPSDTAMSFAVLMLVYALALVMLYWRTGFLRYVPQLANRRLFELIDTGRVPYGVPISLAAVTLIASDLAELV